MTHQCEGQTKFKRVGRGSVATGKITGASSLVSLREWSLTAPGGLRVLLAEASRRFQSLVNATCPIWKTMIVAEMGFRKLDAPQLVEKVARGTKHENGEEVKIKAA